MKKIFKSALAVALLSVSVLSSQVFAADSLNTEKDNGAEIIYSANEITDVDILYDKAVQEEKNQSIKKTGGIKGVLKDEKGNQTDTKTYHTTQKLKEKKYKDGRVEGEYAVTTFADVTNQDLDRASILASDGSIGKDGKDDTLGFKAYSTFYYSYTTSGGSEFRKITRVTGGWTRLDGTYTFGKRTINYGSSGIPQGGGLAISQAEYNTIDLPDISLTFDYTAPTSWKYISRSTTDSSWYTVGVNQSIVLKRSSSTWTFSFANNDV
ncbi:hypothetical protein HQN90_17885 [Paenibacillus alba]|uniref:hypothetical protein n=1 Tax=Paenibacillus alba TaxID=1197127 RepID=UPI0015653A99|nr:hypothetical protein [Paenibacillus alba]NQX67996.1 hypothetical protein [Paenibacillus alba]